ncbi:MAG: UvrD-helicase domain-containing protein, partial [Candidatus Cryosericum sp.]
MIPATARDTIDYADRLLRTVRPRIDRCASLANLMEALTRDVELSRAGAAAFLAGRPLTVSQWQRLQFRREASAGLGAPTGDELVRQLSWDLACLVQAYAQSRHPGQPDAGLVVPAFQRLHPPQVATDSHRSIPSRAWTDIHVHTCYMHVDDFLKWYGPFMPSIFPTLSTPYSAVRSLLIREYEYVDYLRNTSASWSLAIPPMLPALEAECTAVEASFGKWGGRSSEDRSPELKRMHAVFQACCHVVATMRRKEAEPPEELRQAMEYFALFWTMTPCPAAKMEKPLARLQQVVEKMQSVPTATEAKDQPVATVGTTAKDGAADLDKEQQAAVTYRGGNLLVVAGAGSGKTRVLTERAVSLAKAYGSGSLLVVTFTKKAAQEIQGRLEESLDAPEQAWIGTFHSVCWRILRQHGALVGLREGWTVLDAAAAQRCMDVCVRRTEPPRTWDTDADDYDPDDPERWRLQKATDPEEVAALHDYARNALMSWQEAMQLARFRELTDPQTVTKAITAYERRCRRSDRLDFDDLQTLVLRLLEERPAIRAAYQRQFSA